MSWVAVAIGGSAVIGAGASMYGANKAASAAKDGKRNLPNEIGGILGQLPATGAAGLLNQQTYGPAYAGLGNDNQRTGLLGSQHFDATAALAAKSPEELASIQSEAAKTGRTPEEWLTDHTMEQMAQGNGAATADFQKFGGYSGGLADTLGSLQGTQDRLNATSATFQRGANLADMESLSPRAEALRRSTNSEYFSGLDKLDAAAGKSIDATPYEKALGDMALAPAARRTSSLSHGPLYDELQKQALAQLKTNGAITDQEAQQSRNEARAAAEARGLSYSPGAMADEILNLDKYRRQRSSDNQAFASSVDTQGFNQRAAIDASGLAADEFNLQSDNQRAGQLSIVDQLARSRGTEQFARQNTAVQARAASVFDPSSVLGSVDNRLNTTATSGMGQSLFTGAPDYVNSLLSYGSDLNNTNYNAQQAAALNSANAYTSLGGGLLSAAGTVGGSYFANKGAKKAA